MGRKGQAAKMTIEADGYEVAEGVITFVRDGKGLFTIPVTEFAFIALLDDSGNWAFEGNVSML